MAFTPTNLLSSFTDASKLLSQTPTPPAQGTTPTPPAQGTTPTPPAQGTTPITPIAPTTGQKIGDAGEAISGMISGIHQDMSNAAMIDYQNDTQLHKDDKMNFLDPEADVMPDLMKYSQNSPNAEKAFEQGGGVGGDALDYAGKGASMGATVGSAIPGVGTAIGAAVGAVGGGAIGLIKGLFTQGAAADQDAKQRNQDIQQFEIAMRQWQSKQASKRQAREIEGQKTATDAKQNLITTTNEANMTRRQMAEQVFASARGNQPQQYFQPMGR